MINIDFLPTEYRQQHAKRSVQLWRVLVVVGFVAMLSVASLVQYYRLCYATSQLDQLAIQHLSAKAQDEQLTQLQSEVKEATGNADLFAYLRHPWPRTQVLAALLAPLPDSVTLNQLEIKVDAPLRPRSKKARLRSEGKETDEQAEPELPAELDLTMLREQLDTTRVSAVISGRTTDPAALHRYLGKLDRCSLFVKAELDSLESMSGKNEDRPEGSMSFTAVVVLRPGYGQPRGPTGSVRVVHNSIVPTKRVDKHGGGLPRAETSRARATHLQSPPAGEEPS